MKARATKRRRVRRNARPAVHQARPVTVTIEPLEGAWRLASCDLPRAEWVAEACQYMDGVMDDHTDVTKALAGLIGRAMAADLPIGASNAMGRRWTVLADGSAYESAVAPRPQRDLLKKVAAHGGLTFSITAVLGAIRTADDKRWECELWFSWIDPLGYHKATFRRGYGVKRVDGAAEGVTSQP